jgi:glycosyltransferase involved in cell wall biosynthesis
MRISVVIATFNRAPLLAECLDHLSRQRFAPGDEVIVVDNGSTDHTPAVIVQARHKFPIPMRHLVERTPGKSNAIASGLSFARGDVIAFTDDDVHVDASWIDEVRRVMSDTGIALAGGPVAPRWETPPPGWLRAAVESYGRLAAPLGLLNYGTESFPLGPRTALGANLVVRAEVMHKLGGYATHLGKLRGTLLSGEDQELCVRVQSAGFRAVYWPELRVTHWVPAARMRVRYAMSWFYWSGITHAALDAGNHPQRAIGRIPLHFLKRMAAAAARSFGAAATGRLAQMVDNAIDVAFVTGYIARRWGAA